MAKQTHDLERKAGAHGKQFKTDYERNPPVDSADQEKEERDLLAKWQDRKDEAEEDRKKYLPQVKINRKFAAGKQHLDVNVRDGRVLDVRVRGGQKMVTADILSQYLLTAVGRMSGTDYRPNFLALQDNEMSAAITRQMNMAFGWCWENEVQAEKKILSIWRLLVVDGTCGLRVRYNKNFGDVVGEFPHKEGQPITDTKQAHEYVTEAHKNGESADIKAVKEGKVELELLTMDNLLVPPGIADPDDFPWIIVCRPVLITDLKNRYPETTEHLVAEEIEASGDLTAGLGFTDETSSTLKNRVMLYTGYELPCASYPKGQVVVWTADVIHDSRGHLPFDSHPRGPSTGVHFFRWGVIPGRFWGKGFIEGGIGPQQVRNKRLTQIDTIIDRNLPKVFVEEQSLARPKTGEPMEVIEVRPGSPLPQVNQGVPPGAWMLSDVKLQEENAERALGMRAITTGTAPAGVSAYSALALLTENDSLKLDPIAQDFRMEFLEVSWDIMESMRNWPSHKHILISGPEGRVDAFFFNSNDIPNKYLVKPPRGGALPRSQASELQKVTDIWTAAASTGRPLPLEWYVESLNQGKPQDLPPSLANQQQHKAELENIAMAQSLMVAPVAEYDDDAKHVASHRAFQVPLKTIADLGDENAAQQVEVLEIHIREHEASAASKAQPQTPAPNQGVPEAPMEIGNPQQGNRPQAPPSGVTSPTVPNIPSPSQV